MPDSILHNNDDLDVRTQKRKRLKTILLVLIVLVAVKVLWTVIATWNNGSFESEKSDILRRQNYLKEKIITTPKKLLDRMPSAVGPQFQGELNKLK